MATPEHLEASTFVKSVHKKLREAAKVVGSEKAWDEHQKDEATLNRYAAAMKDLAELHWEENRKKDTRVASRIEWIHESCVAYFKNGGIEYQRKREIDISERCEIKFEFLKRKEINSKLKLLDVGSCYNPFARYDCYDVSAIDIAPSKESVFKCDFLNISISDEQKAGDEIESLKSDSFDIVVFSLLLEYFPDPQQRLKCCENAYGLLKDEGILVVVTPDAKHVGANAKYMKSWRFVLSKLGFCRIKYEKLQYIHCMVFRKSLNKKVAVRWSELNENKNLFDKIYIPQDFNDG